MDISTIVFPLYKLRSHLSIEKNPLGIVKITTIKGTYILDDQSLDGDFQTRRVKMYSEYSDEKIYKLKEKVIYLRHLVKYKSGTFFVDSTGKIIKYKKSSRLYPIKSKRIERKIIKENWTNIYVAGLEIPFVVGHALTYKTKYASIMYTDWGPFLYDLTSKQHEVYLRKI